MPRKGENKIKMKEEKNSEEMEVDKCDKKGKTKKPETPKEYTQTILIIISCQLFLLIHSLIISHFYRKFLGAIQNFVERGDKMC